MATTLYLVRHGETEGGDVKRYKGSIDIPLSPRGVRQIEESAAFIEGHAGNIVRSRRQGYLREALNVPEHAVGGDGGLAAVYCSSLVRALKSAEIIAEPYGLTPVVFPDLRERSFGAWENMSFSEIREQYPAEFDAWAKNPLEFSPVGGENTIEVRDRVLRAFEEIMSRHNPATGDNIALVAHGGVNRILLCHIMGVPLENIFRIEQDYAAVNIIEFWDKYPVVKLLNRACAG